ncbi:MAG TPA: hypothetical protein ENF67_01020, partial [Candidatus Pacearchaeota archaeon]|nr:hypothetical protein [Candidatus Pacearchaeota archaeon]
MKQKLATILMVILVAITLSTTALAILEDKIYDKETRTITIRNWLNQPIVSLRLLNNTDQCLVNCYAIIEITPHIPEAFPKPIEIKLNDKLYGIKFLTKTNKNALGNLLKDYKIKVLSEEIYYVDVPDYEETTCKGYRLNNETGKNETYYYKCKKQVGSHKEKRVRKVWKEAKAIDLSKKQVIKIEARKLPMANVEWMPNFYGFELKEWAWWNSNWSYRKPITITEQSGNT